MQRQENSPKRLFGVLVDSLLTAVFRTGENAPDAKKGQEWQSNTMKLRQLIVVEDPVLGNDMVRLRIKGARRGTPHVFLPQWVLKGGYTLVSDLVDDLDMDEDSSTRASDSRQTGSMASEETPVYRTPTPTRSQREAGECMCRHLAGSNVS